MPAPSAPSEIRLQQFAQWVRRALAHAQTTRGWSVPRIANRAGIGSNTIYRWRNARGIKMPSPDQVVAFADALELPAVVPLRILWPGRYDPAGAGPSAATEPVGLPPDLIKIARKLQDPNVPEHERYYLRETLRALADRPARPSDPPRR